MGNRLLYVLTIAFACGGSNHSKTDAPTSDTPTADAPLTANEACSQSATMHCTQLQTCSPFDLEKKFGDLTTCEARISLQCTDALAAPGTANTPDNVVACATATSSESCTAFLSDKTIPTACITKTGSADTASSCQFAAQCSSAFCDFATDEVCGECAAQPVVGTSCASQTCGQNLICVTATETCQVPVEAGSACTKDLPCDNALTCVGSGSGSAGSGTCVADIGSAGATCDHTHKTLPGCDADLGLFCDILTDQCVALTFADIGSACGTLNGIDVPCGSAATCGSGSGAICIATADDGGDCDPDQNINCFTPARCVPAGSGSSAGTCVLPGTTTCP
jgi:hypothetical protein